MPSLWQKLCEDPMSKAELKLDWCSHEAAKYACVHWHYSKCTPNQKLVKIGVWEDGRFIGCILFGDGANNQMFKPYGLDYTQGCELVRIALTSHKTTVSRIMSISFKFLRKACPKIELIVSFADPEQNHLGGIYQASNWLYAGMTTPADEYLVNGRRMHGRALRSTRATHKLKNVASKNIMEWAAKVLDPNIKSIQGSSKHRYLYPLTPEMKAKIELLRKPYPKRAIVKGSQQANADNGGSLPTRSLQSSKVLSGDEINLVGL